MSATDDYSKSSEKSKAMMRSGRKCKYEPWMCGKVVEIAKEGGFHAAMMNAIGVSRGTFYHWIRDIPDFKDAIEQADQITQQILEERLMDGMAGKIKNYNVTANMFVLSNKYKSYYNRASGSETNGDTNITINQVNLTSEQLQEKINQKFAKLRALGVEVNVPIQIENLDDKPD